MTVRIPKRSPLHSSQPSWSPDAKRIAFTSREPDGTQQINVVTTSTRRLRQLTHAATPAVRPVWSPDGRSIAFLAGDSGRAGTFELAVMKPDGTKTRRLSNPADLDPGTAGDQDPAWSPDSKAITFSSHRYGGREVWLVKPNGSGLQRLGDNAAALVWSPSGQRLAYVVNAPGVCQIRQWYLKRQSEHVVLDVRQQGCELGGLSWQAR